MALNTRRGVAALNASVDTMLALLHTGYIRVYSGDQPATPNTAITTQVLLIEWRFGNPAFAGAANGVAAANPMATQNALGGGTAAWFRCLKADGTTPVFDGSCGLAAANMVLATLTIVLGTPQTLSSFTYTALMQGA